MPYKGLLVFPFILIISACFDGSSSKNKAIPVIADNDYLQNVMVCSDCNGNRICEPTEKQQRSNNDGYVFSNHFDSSCPLLAEVTLNATMKMTSRQPENEFKMVSPVNCDVITPMTSILEQAINKRTTKNRASQSLQSAMLTDFDLCKDYLKEETNPKSTPISRKEARLYMNIAKDYINDYGRRAQLIEQSTDLPVLSSKDKHELITFNSWRGIDKYRAFSRFNLTRGNKVALNDQTTSSDHDELTEAEIDELVYENLLETQMKNAVTVNLFSTFNSNQNTTFTRYYEVSEGLKSTELSFNDSALTEFQIYWPLNINEAIIKPSVLGVDGYQGLSSQTNSVIDLSFYYNFKSYENKVEVGDISEQIIGMELINRSYQQLDYVVSTARFSIADFPVYTLMKKFGGIDSWAKATKGSGIKFPDSNESIAYFTSITPLVDGVIFENKPCNSNVDDPIKNLCHYVDVIRPYNRAKGAKNVETFYSERTKSGYIYQAGISEIPDILYLGSADISSKEKGSHILAYKQTEDRFLVVIVNGDLRKLTIEESGEPNNIYLQFYNPSDNPKDEQLKNITDNDHYATTTWGVTQVNGHEVAVIKIPNSFRELLPNLPSLLAITKIGLYDRQGDFVQRYGLRGREHLGLDNENHSIVEQAVQQNRANTSK